MAIPSALGVTGDVVFEAVLLDLKHVVEGPVQFLHRHLDGALQASRLSMTPKNTGGRRTSLISPQHPPSDGSFGAAFKQVHDHTQRNLSRPHTT